MGDKAEPFDNLVAGLSLDDRASILKQMKSKIKPEETVFDLKDSHADLATDDGSKSFSHEPFFTRIILYIKSLFQSQSVDVVYAEHRISKLSKKIEARYPQIFNSQRITLEQGFYEQLVELRKISAFFQAEILYSNDNPNDFLIVLGSLFMGDIEKKIDEVSNPFSISFTQEISNDMRASLLRKMELVLAEVSPQNKSILYTCVRSLNWLSAFVNLPFDSFIQKFSPASDGRLNCLAHSAKSEIEKFASVLGNAKNIEPEVLEALYLFYSQSQLKPGERLEIEVGIDTHVEMSRKCIVMIRRFSDSVPIKSIGKIAFNSLSWEPTYKESGEDWFVQYKAQWKRIFDRKWSKWLQDKKLFTTKLKVTQFCGTNDYPFFPNRPWLKDNVSQPFSKDYSLGFLYAFFKNVYPKYHDALKILMARGEFILRDNKVEFTDTYTEMNTLGQTINELNIKLSPQGLHGQNFSQLSSDFLRTVQGQMQAQMLVQAVESEVSMIILTFGNACRSLISIFGGILIAKYNANYDTISNIASLAGPDNKPIRKHLLLASESINEALDILKDIGGIEVTGNPGE